MSTKNILIGAAVVAAIVVLRKRRTATAIPDANRPDKVKQSANAQAEWWTYAGQWAM